MACQGSDLFEVDYPSYLSRHDIVYLSPPTEGYEGFPLGNGDLGAMVWCTPSGLRVQINKTDTWDQPTDECGMLLRSCGQLSINVGAPSFEWLYLDDFEARLSLHKAHAVFTSAAPFMRTSVDAFVAAHRNVLVLRCHIESQGELAPEGALARIALERWGSRGFPGWYSRINRGGQLGLGKARAGAGERDINMEESLQDLDFAVACRVVGSGVETRLASRHRAEVVMPPKPTHDFVILVAVVTSAESDHPLQAATALLDRTEKDGLDRLQADHQRWWADFWSRSFIHLGDDYLENLYYLHMYLMGSGSRGRYPVLFNGGLWTWNHDVRQWVHPHHWNMQQAYWSVCAANRTDLMQPYLDTYWRLAPKAQDYARCRGFHDAILWNEKHDYAGRMVDWQGSSFVNDFTPATQIGQAFWQRYLYTGDETFLRERAYPFMKAAAEFYLQYLKRDAATGEYFIFPASPYECEVGNEYRNTITDLAMIRSSFPACIEASQRLNVDPDKRAQWQQVLDHLAEYPLVTLPEGEALGIAQDAEGHALQLMGQEYTFCCATSPVFPAGNLGIKDAGSRLYEAAARRVTLHPEHQLAISPVAVVAARLGMADEALRRLAMTVRQLQHFPQGLFYNIDHWHMYSRYADAVPDSAMACQRDYITDRACGYRGISVNGADERVDLPMQPFVQCGLEPLAILATAVNEMLLQSYDGVIRVFAATPADWSAAFTLRAVGGFLVSSERDRSGRAKAILIESLLGKGCRLAEPWPGEPVSVQAVGVAARPAVEVTLDDGVLSFPTSVGCTYVVRPAREAGLPPATCFAGEPNRGPKEYREAVLGKRRDF